MEIFVNATGSVLKRSDILDVLLVASTKNDDYNSAVNNCLKTTMKAKELLGLEELETDRMSVWKLNKRTSDNNIIEDAYYYKASQNCFIKNLRSDDIEFITKVLNVGNIDGVSVSLNFKLSKELKDEVYDEAVKLCYKDATRQGEAIVKAISPGNGNYMTIKSIKPHGMNNDYIYSKSSVRGFGGVSRDLVESELTPPNIEMRVDLDFLFSIKS